MFTYKQNKTMFRTLGDLRQTVDRLIKEQGIDSPCASFIYTKNDVYCISNEDDSEVPCSDEVTENVLFDIGDSSWFYEQFSNAIEDAISEHNH